MPDNANPRAVLGGNKPPLDDPSTLVKRLEADNKALIGEAANLEVERMGLPAEITTDEEAGRYTDHIVKARDVIRAIETMRTTETAPYIEGQRKVNAFAKELSEPISEQVDNKDGKLVRKIGAYNAAKAERERAERLAREREEREEQERRAIEERAEREAAEKAQREADEAAARIRAAKDAESRKAAEKEMREKEEAAAEARRKADEAAKAAAQAERKADTNARAADGPTSKLSRTSTGSSGASITKEWTFRVEDADALVKSLGPLGRWLNNDAITTAIGAALREHKSAGTVPSLSIPGVSFFEADRTNIYAARK